MLVANPLTAFTVGRFWRSPARMPSLGSTAVISRLGCSSKRLSQANSLICTFVRLPVKGARLLGIVNQIPSLQLSTPGEFPSAGSQVHHLLSRRPLEAELPDQLRDDCRRIARSRALIRVYLIVHNVSRPVLWFAGSHGLCEHLIDPLTSCSTPKHVIITQNNDI